MRCGGSFVPSIYIIQFHVRYYNWKLNNYVEWIPILRTWWNQLSMLAIYSYSQLRKSNLPWGGIALGFGTPGGYLSPCPLADDTTTTKTRAQETHRERWFTILNFKKILHNNALRSFTLTCTNHSSSNDAASCMPFEIDPLYSLSLATVHLCHSYLHSVVLLIILYTVAEQRFSPIFSTKTLSL